MNKKSLLLLISGVALSACGQGYSSYQNGFYGYHKNDSSGSVVSNAYDVSLSDVREVYKDSNVEVYDIDQYPSMYKTQRRYARPPIGYDLNKKIPVKDKSVEIYDLGFAQVPNNVAAPRDITSPYGEQNLSLSPPSNAQDDFQSPFLIVEDDEMLTDPMSGENTQTSVIVAVSDDGGSYDDVELMTGF